MILCNLYIQVKRETYQNKILKATIKCHHKYIKKSILYTQIYIKSISINDTFENIHTHIDL
jgi:hypothetical protein